MNRFLKILQKALTIIVKILTIINLIVIPIFSYFVGQELQLFRLARGLGGIVCLSSLITCVLVVILALLSRDIFGKILWVIYGVVFCFYFPFHMTDWIERRFSDKPCVTVAFVSSKREAKNVKSSTYYYYWFKDVDGKVIKGKRTYSKKFHPKDTFLVVFNESATYSHYSFKNAPTKEEIDKYIDGPKRISQEEYEKWREDYDFF
ncbi:MAG: hypothetical protein J6Q03_08235 [Paludibacteraceae bacterium]|nr:hypothetical protein [Paludibacteraceae bacterium]